jgi:hypothetical protein
MPLEDIIRLAKPDSIIGKEDTGSQPLWRGESEYPRHYRTVADFAGVTMQEQAELVQRLRGRYETCDGHRAVEPFRSLTGHESYDEHGQRTYSGTPSTTSLLVLRTVILSRKGKNSLYHALFD